MSDVERKMNILIDEANANYDANRYKDAARTFEHLVPLALKNNEPEEAVYFGYRAADCWLKDKNEFNRAIIFKNLANIALEAAAQISETISKKSSDNKVTAKALKLAGECFKSIEPKKGKKLLNDSILYFEKLAKAEKETRNKIPFLLDAIEVAEINSTKSKIKKLKSSVANLKIEIAEDSIKKKTQEHMTIALREYEDALSLLESVGTKIEIEELKSKIEEIQKLVEEYDPFAT